MPDDALRSAPSPDLCALRSLYGEVSERAAKKQMDRLEKHCRAFIGLSPFIVIASSDVEGRTDASPKGDAPGFVHVLDDRTIAIPDRLGNNRIDTLQNVAANQRVGILFLVPGMNETLRVNGRARITTDPAILESLSANGKPPRSALLVETEEVYFHCGKALIRSDLWNPEKKIERRSFPTFGQILADQIGGMDPVKAEESVQDGYRTRLY
jgi:PPOX class probable FMN-dependent enzyme